jgi:hypothetical protein
MKTYTLDAAYEDDDGGNRCDIVIAPDEATAKRLAAVQILEDNEWSLEDRGNDTLSSFYESEIDLLATWTDLKGTACPNCTSHGGRDTGQETELGGTVHECATCGYTWLPMGFGKLRAQLEEAATKAIANLDVYEARSKLGDDACRNEECSEDATGGDGYDGYCGNCADRREGSDEE